MLSKIHENLKKEYGENVYWISRASVRGGNDGDDDSDNAETRWNEMMKIEKQKIYI